MTITHIKLTNFRGLMPIDQKLPAICFVQGKNELGKTAFLDAILYLWDKGHDDDNITVGADTAEIIATMADGMQVRAVLKRGVGTERMTKKPGAKRWSVGREEIDALVKGIGYNPLEFMQMKPKEQLALLLKLMPVEVSADEMVEALKPLAGFGKELGASLNQANTANTDTLSKIAAMRKVVYDERTGVNRSADTQTKHAAELEASMGPATEEKDWGVKVARLEAILAAEEEKKADSKNALKVHVDEVKESADKQYEAEVQEARQKRDKRIEDARAYTNKQWEITGPTHDAAINSIVSQLSVARERDRLSASHASTRKAVEVARQSAASLTKQSKALTEALANLDKLQTTIADRLPIPGIRFVDGVLCNDKGIPFSKWNTATQTFFCLKLALLMGTNFIILDRGIEVLDPDNQKAFLERANQLAEERGIQFFLASITADPALTIGEVK